MIRNLFIGLAFFAVTACSDGNGSDAGPLSTSVPLAGMGVKGPLSGAVVTAYQVDPNAAALKGSPLGVGETDASANIINLEIPADTAGLILLEFEADADTVDLTTGVAPVLSVLTTVIDPARVVAGEPIYATALTTFAVDVASANAGSAGVFSGDGDGDVSLPELEAALSAAAGQVQSTLGFGLLEDVDIFTTAPVLNTGTSDLESQSRVAAYRVATEALVAVLAEVQAAVVDSGTDISTDAVLQGLVTDFADGVLDGQADGVAIETFADVASLPALLTQDPSTLQIPNTDLTVADVVDVLIEEATAGGVPVASTPIANSEVPVPDPAPASLEADADGDGVGDSADNCAAAANANQVDTDTDGAGDACDPDDDNDTVADADDAFPLDPGESVDTDADGTGNNADVDDDGDGVLDAADAFPLDATESVDTDSDGQGDNADMDDDGDGTPDTADAFPLDPEESADTDGDGTGNNADTDDDNDGIPDDLDQLPVDPDESVDTDGDGTGNNADTDDDGDMVPDVDDNCPLTANPDQTDTDGNGQGDACSSLAVWDQTNWDEANWQ